MTNQTNDKVYLDAVDTYIEECNLPNSTDRTPSKAITNYYNGGSQPAPLP